MLRQRFVGHPGVHGVKLVVAVRKLDAARRQQLPAGELQLVVVHVAHVCHVVADQVVEVALILHGLLAGLRMRSHLDPSHVFLQGFSSDTSNAQVCITV